MDIKFKDSPVTIKTIEVGGKKMTKQLLQQVKLFKYDFIKDNPDSYISYDLVYNSNDNNFTLNCELKGWINVKLEKDEQIYNLLTISPDDYKLNFISILIITNNGELRRSYIDEHMFNRLFKNKYPQIFF